MNGWRNDPGLPYAIAAVIGMVAGVAAKWAVAIQSGHILRRLSVVADVLVLGMIWLLAMYLHNVRPSIPLEGIALFAAAMAMWGPKGIAALLSRFQRGALKAADTFTRSVLDPIEPVHRPTVVEALEREKEEAMDTQVEGENRYAKTAPIRKLRDIVPQEVKLPVDQVELLGKADQVDPFYHPPTKKEGEEERRKENDNGK